MSAVPLNDDLRTLYQEIILDHGKNPRNAHLIAGHTCKAQGNNPMCGDRVTVTAKIADGVMQDIGFEGKGCAISIASASMMTDALKGQSTVTAQKLFEAMQELCTGKSNADDIKTRFGADLETSVERLASLSGVSQFPTRVKCATLPWHALMSCLEGKGQTTTEKRGETAMEKP